jgi:hypothetical protein
MVVNCAHAQGRLLPAGASAGGDQTHNDVRRPAHRLL